MDLPLVHKKLEEQIAEAPSYEVSFRDGLSPEQVSAREKAGLVNKTKKHVTKSYAKIIFDNVFNFFNVLLIIIFVLMLFGRLVISSYFFMLILFANSMLGLIQDIHARHLVDKLRLVTEPKAKIVRRGSKLVLPVDQIVLGDIVALDAGDQISADSILVEGSISCDESLLTGEAIPVPKIIGSTIFSGTYVTKGHCHVKVVKVGAANYAETLQKQASSFRRPRSEIKTGITSIFWIAGVIAIILGLAMTITWVSRGDLTNREYYNDFILSLSGSMVAMIPAGMYLLTSLTLAVGVILLARKRMLVQELYCIEMLARVDVLCLDKTGTLTDGSMMVENIYPTSGLSDEEIEEGIRAVVYSVGDNNATALALKRRFPLPYGEVPTHVISFDSDSKYSAASFKDRGTFIVGAYGFVDARENEEAALRIDFSSKAGYRCLCLYRNKREIDKGLLPGKSDLVAVIALSDHIKEDAATNIAWFKNNGVAIRVISGDNPLTVSQIAAKVGVDGAANYVSCEGRTDAELIKMAATYTVFGRVTPEQKEVLIKAYKQQGHTVAMTGDGVNDILALKTADCSIAMASGSEAARNVSHLVSLDNDFSKLPSVVDQGRRVINNLQRTCSLFLSKTLFAMVLTVAFLVSHWIGGMTYPFSTQNMMVWEVVSIGFSAFFLALQPSDERLKGSFIENIVIKAVPSGLTEIMAVVLSMVVVIAWPGSVTTLASSSGDLSWLFSQRDQLPMTQVLVILAVISFTAVSFVVLFRVCWPLNRYRSILLICMGAFGLAFFILDAVFPRLHLLNLSWGNLSWSFPLVVFAIVAICSGFYFLVDWGIKKIAHKASGGRVI